MISYILRGVFLLLAAAVATLYVLPSQVGLAVPLNKVILMLGGALGLAAIVISVDVFTPHKKLSAVSGVFLGLIVGLIAAYALSFVVDLIALLTAPNYADVLPNADELIRSGIKEDKLLSPRDAYLNLLEGVKVFIGLITSYVGITLVLQTKDDFRFVIPYVEFAKDVRGQRPTLLDTSVIIDGRIVDIITTHISQGGLIVPRFVLNELQNIADSSDKLRRARGKRGLETLQKLQSDPSVDLLIEEADAEGAGVDQKLVSLAQNSRCRIMTNDVNLAKIAELRGVEVINLNDLAKALRPVVLPGETMEIKIIKPGESAGQGVGYLDDGTMVVVENSRRFLGEMVDLVVTSSLQTSAGRMIFGRTNQDAPSHDAREASSTNASASHAPSSSDSGDSHPPTTHASPTPTPSAPPATPTSATGDTTQDHSHEPPHTPRRHSGRNPRR